MKNIQYYVDIRSYRLYRIANSNGGKFLLLAYL